MVWDRILENYFYCLNKGERKRAPKGPGIPVQSLSVSRRNCYPWLASFSAMTNIVSEERHCPPFSLSFWWHLLSVPLGDMTIACPGYSRGPFQGRCFHLSPKGSFPAPSFCHRKCDRPGKRVLPPSQGSFIAFPFTAPSAPGVDASKRESE